MTAVEIQDIIVTTVGQLTILAGGMMTMYFKLKGSGTKRAESIKEEVRSAIQEVKQHQDVSLQRLNGMLSYIIHSFGRPAWVKVARETPQGVEFRMLEVNREYCETYGIERLDYIGKTDLEAGWPLNVANEFRKNDLTVWASGEAIEVNETNNGKKMRFRKFRVASCDGQLKGIFGYAVDCADPNSCPVFDPNHS